MTLPQFFFRAGRIAVISYGIAVIAGCAFQQRLVFIPSRKLGETPAAVGLPFEEVWLTAADGVKIQAWWIPAPGAKGAVIHCHGNAGNISHRLHKAEMWYRAGYSCLLFDYRGYGQSGGKISEAGLYLDAEAAWAHVIGARGFAPDHVVIHGTSLGGGVASRLAMGKAPAGLVLESTFYSLADAAAYHYPWLPVRLLLRYRFPVGENLAQVDCPVLILHGPQDEVIPFINSQRLLKVAKHPEPFIPLQGGHNDAMLEYDASLRHRYLAVLDRWVSTQKLEPEDGVDGD